MPPEAQMLTVGMITGVIWLMKWARVTIRWAKLGKIFVVGLLPLIGNRLRSWKSYVIANYHFIVHPGWDFRAQAINPDDPLPWSLVLQVLASAQTQLPTYPICFSTPVALRISKWGPIFCLQCLIRYMASVEDAGSPTEGRPKYKKCAMRMESAYLA